MHKFWVLFLMSMLGNASCESKQRSRTVDTATAHPPHTDTADTVPADYRAAQSTMPSGQGNRHVAGALVTPKESLMLTGKPYLSIQVEAFHVPLDIFVNGGYVTTDLTGTTVSEKWPINPLLRSGTNEIGVLMYGWADGPAGTFEDDAKLTLRVLVKQADSDVGQEHELFVMAFDGSSTRSDVATEGSTAEGSLDSGQGFRRVDHGDVELGPVKVRRIPAENATVLTRSLKLRLPFAEWAFLRSDRLVPTIEVEEAAGRIQHDNLLLAYEEIWSLLSSRNLDKLMPLFEERSREIDLALYHDPGTTQTKLRDAFESALADHSCALAPVRRPKGRWYYNVAPGGQLARLTTSDHGGAVIRFSFKDSNFARVFPISFRKQGSRYIVAR